MTCRATPRRTPIILADAPAEWRNAAEHMANELAPGCGAQTLTHSLSFGFLKGALVGIANVLPENG
jgi:hypothetical protein